MRNGKRKPQNDALFVAFYNMRAVTFVLPDEMADVSISGLQWFILKPHGSHMLCDSHSKPYLHSEQKYKIWNKNHQPATIIRIKRKAVICLILVASQDMPQRKAEVLFCILKNSGTPWGLQVKGEKPESDSKLHLLLLEV